MNKRIRELADESAKYAAIIALPTGKGGDELFLEKFTELIIKEFIKLGGSASGWCDGDYYTADALQEEQDGDGNREWVGLTGPEVDEAYLSVSDKEWAIGGLTDARVFFCAIEAKLKEKNT